MSIYPKNPPEKLSEPFSAHRWYPYLLIMVLGYLLCQQVLSFGFTFFDDNALILDNYNFLKNPLNIIQAFREQVFHAPNTPILYYRPILTVSFIIDACIGGISPFIYHLTNIAIHLAASCLVFLFLLKLNYRRQSALVLSLIFVAHPALAPAVGWIPGRNDSLLAVFVLSSFILFIKFLENRRWMYYVGHIIFFALAIFTKESAVVLPVLYILYYFVRKERIGPSREIIVAAGWCITAACWVLLRRLALGQAAGLNVFEIGHSVILNIAMLVQSAGKIVLPFNLSVFPVKRDISAIYGIVTIAALAVFLIRSKYRRPLFMLFGISWFILFLIPSFVRPSPEISAFQMDFSEHRLYLPMIGFFIILAECDMVKNVNLRKPCALAVFIPVLALFSCLSFIHSKNFENRFAFWNNAVKSSPNSAWVHLNVGLNYYLTGNPDKAEREYRRSLALNPQQPFAHAKLGIVYMDKKMFKEAEAELTKEAAINPLYDGTWAVLGTLYYKEGKSREAEDMWKRALGLNPENFDARKNLVIYYCENKDFKAAAHHVRELQKRGIPIPQNILDIVGE